MDDPGALRRELMAIFDELPPALREAINYAPDALDPKDLAALCRRHGAANVLAMIELKLSRAGKAAPRQEFPSSPATPGRESRHPVTRLGLPPSRP
jgi:hypothetical protein